MPTTRVMSARRAIPIAPDTAMQRVMLIPLPPVFRRGYGPIAAIADVRGQSGEWGTVGQTRTLVQSRGAGTFFETLVAVEPPDFFRYRLTRITGPAATVVSRIDGEWSFAPIGTGTQVTWQWRAHAASGVASVLLPGFERAWRGFARQALEDLERVLLAPPQEDPGPTASSA